MSAPEKKSLLPGSAGIVVAVTLIATIVEPMLGWPWGGGWCALVLMVILLVPLAIVGLNELRPSRRRSVAMFMGLLAGLHVFLKIEAWTGVYWPSLFAVNASVYACLAAPLAAYLRAALLRPRVAYLSMTGCFAGPVLLMDVSMGSWWTAEVGRWNPICIWVFLACVYAGIGSIAARHRSRGGLAQRALKAAGSLMGCVGLVVIVAVVVSIVSPPKEGSTSPLFIAPGVVLLIAGVVAWWEALAKWEGEDSGTGREALTYRA